VLGTPTDEVVGAVIGEGRQGRERGGLMEAARNQATTLADTATHAAAYAGRQVAWKAAGVKALVWHSMLDSRTTIGCAVRAGKLYSVDLEPIGHDVPIDQPPPRHWNCRSVLIAQFPDYEPPEDGQDPYEESLDDWLDRHSEEEQNDMLGPTRAALWRADKITARDLLGLGGDELSVDDLRDLRSISAYDIAKAGGRYAEFLNEREKYTISQLKSSARSYEKTILISPHPQP
jgi:SPP1 gp7 family putative phage head morphogenesis protein